MCKYSAFKGTLNCNCNVQILRIQRGPNSNCNVLVPFFQRSPNSTDNMSKCSAFKGASNSNCMTREVRCDASLLSLNFYLLLALSSQLSVFLKLCIMKILLHFLLCQPCRGLRNISLDGPHIPFLGLIERSYHGWLSTMTSSHGPFSPLPRAPPTLCSPLIRSV